METDKNISELKVGDPAPDFTLPTPNEGELNLSWYQNRKNVVLAFYPADWTPVCATQVPEYQNLIEKFENFDCQILCISVDAVPCHKAWAKSLGGLSFPLMS
ncbi:MAG: redoxin domain-containing protein, partial [Candidatus Zixiibacteriota bacterium]